MLKIKDLEAHRNTIIAEIKELEALRERLGTLKSELKATILLIESERQRVSPNAAIKPTADKAEDRPKSVRAAVERYFDNGSANEWTSVNELTLALEDVMPNNMNLYSSVGMACGKLYNQDVLMRKNSSETKAPVYLYRLKS